MSYGIRQSTGIIKPRSSLMERLVGYWQLDEAAGDALDAQGNVTLVAAGSPGQVEGKVCTARSFSGSQWFTRAVEPQIQIGNTVSCTVCCWCYPTTLQTQGMVCRWGGSTDEFALWMSSSTRFTMNLGDGQADANNYGNVQSSVWQFVIGWWQVGSNELGIQVNDTAPNTSTMTMNAAGTSPVTIGAIASDFIPFAGRIDAVGFWKRVLTAQERARLYNNGNGLKYPFNPQ